jgi:chemotaxis protein MotB
MSREKKPEDPGPQVPGYLVSFGDMMTILLTFFILLCTYATQSKAGYVADGIGSFRLAIEALGLPGLLPRDRAAIELGAQKIRYKTREREEAGERDQDERRISDEVEALRRARVQELPLDGEVRIALPVRFAPGTADPLAVEGDLLGHVAGLVTTGRRVEIIGHADHEDLSRGERSRLALRRATVVVTTLVERYGVAPEGLVVGAAVRPRAVAAGATPTGDITLRVYRPGRFEPARIEEE